MTVKAIANILIKCLSAIAVIAAGCIGIIYFGASVPLLLIMAAFMLFYVLLPGCLAIKASGLSGQHISTYLIRGFFAGFAINILLYFLTDLISNNVLLYAVGPVLSIIYLGKEFQNRSDRKVSLRSLVSNIPASLFLFFALVFIYSFLTTQCTYIPPYISAFESIKLDFGFHAGIINGLADGFPPNDTWVSGMSLYYHFFTEMLYSIPVRLFGVHSEEVLLSCTPYIIAPVLSCALYSLFREFTNSNGKHGFYCLSLILSNMFVLKFYPNSWFLYHLFSNINNAGMGAACMLTALPVLKAWDHIDESESERRRAGDVMLLAVLVMLNTGIKGPMAVVLVGGMVGTVILGLIMRQVNWRVAAATAISAVAFIFIYVYVVGARGVSSTNAGGNSLINLWEVTDIFFLKGRVADLFSNRALSMVAVLAAFVLISLTAFTLPFILGYIRELWMVLSGRKDFSFSRVTVYASCMVGLIALMVLNYSGHSQVYFGFAALILVPIIAFWYLEDIQVTKPKLAKVIAVIFIVCLCFTAVTEAQDYARLVSNAQKHYEKRDRNSHKYRNVSTDEYEALVWIRDNTPEDSLIASDRYYSVSLKDYSCDVRGHNTHFAYAIYSERDQYLEGSGFSLPSDMIETRVEMINNIDSMMDSKNAERGDLARSLDVDYVLVSKRFNKAGDLSNEDYKLVYTNDDVDIYEVKAAS